MKTRLMGLLAWPLLAAGCQSGSDDASAPQPPVGETLRLECAMAGGTRAGTDVQTSAFAENNTVSVWLKNVMEGSTRRTAFTEYACTVAANGTTLTPPNNTELNYVGPGEYVSAYAVAPTAGFSGTTFTVAANQTADANYLASDLVFSEQKTYAQTSGALRLQFRHLLTKIIVNIQKGEDITDEQFATAQSRSVVLRNIKLATTFDSANGQTVVSPSDATGEAGTVTFNVGGACVIPPQTIAAGKSFISIHETGDVFQGNYVPEGQKTFEGGKQYTYTVTIERNKTTVSATVEDWNVIEADAASTYHSRSHYDLTSSDVKVGMVICSEGYACPPGLFLPCGHQPVAVVAYVKSTSETPSPDASGNYRGLAVSIDEVGNTLKWYTASSQSCLPAYATRDFSTALEDLNGIAYTNHLANSDGSPLVINDASYTCSGHTHAAADAVVEYESKVEHPENCSQWFLPTIGQWNLILQGITGFNTNIVLGTTTNVYKVANISSFFTALGGTAIANGDYFWSSTMVSASQAYKLRFATSYVNGSAVNKSAGTAVNGKVRAVIAF